MITFELAKLPRVLILLIMLLALCRLAAEVPETKEAKELEMQKIHEEMAVNLFNQSWDLLLKENRNRADEDVLLNTVHASLYHWRQIGQQINVLRGEWMICHVYTLLMHKEAAIYHAENVLRLMEEIKPVDWDFAYCYEAMARVQALLGDRKQFEVYYQKALEAGKKIAEEGSRQQFDSDMQDEYWFGMK